MLRSYDDAVRLAWVKCRAPANDIDGAVVYARCGFSAAEMQLFCSSDHPSVVSSASSSPPPPHRPRSMHRSRSGKKKKNERVVDELFYESRRKKRSAVTATATVRMFMVRNCSPGGVLRDREITSAKTGFNTGLIRQFMGPGSGTAIMSL